MMGQKLLIPTTLLLMFLSFIAVWRAPLSSPLPYAVDVSSFNTFGDEKAPIHLILFEEFACGECRRFHMQDLPSIEENYIKPGIAKITFVPLAYLERSKNAFISANYIAKKNKEHQRDFLSHIYSLSVEEVENSSPYELLNSYDSSFERSLSELSNENILLENTANQNLSNQIQGGDIEVPLLLVNGKRVHKIDLKTIAKVIEDEKRR